MEAARRWAVFGVKRTDPDPGVGVVLLDEMIWLPPTARRKKVQETVANNEKGLEDKRDDDKPEATKMNSMRKWNPTSKEEDARE